MNKIFIILVLLSGTITFGQEKKAEQSNDNPKMTAEQMATLQTKKMTLALDLSKTQQDQMYALNLEKAKARKAMMEERKAAKENGERKKPSSDERYEMANKRLDAKIAQKEKLKEILSEEQMAKFEKMNHGKRKHMGRKGKRKKGRSRK